MPKKMPECGARIIDMFCACLHGVDRIDIDSRPYLKASDILEAFETIQRLPNKDRFQHHKEAEAGSQHTAPQQGA